jgi:hypothetical protein
MQFVAPAQFFLVLWLLAATAPAATALVNGSLVALIDARSKDLQILLPEERTLDEVAQGDAFTFIDATHSTDVTTLICLALSQGDAAIPFVARENTVSYVSGEQPIALSFSLMHTAVQRHRPKLA